MKSLIVMIILGILGPIQIILLLSTLGIVFVPVIFFLVTLQKTLTEISIENRKMPPNQVWLTLIPLFGVVWQFVMVNRISDSLKAEFSKREIKIDENDPGKNVGLAFCILNCCIVIPPIRLYAIAGAFICWIIYWIKIHNYKIKLQQSDSSKLQ